MSTNHSQHSHQPSDSLSSSSIQSPIVPPTPSSKSTERDYDSEFGDYAAEAVASGSGSGFASASQGVQRDIPTFGGDFEDSGDNEQDDDDGDGEEASVFEGEKSRFEHVQTQEDAVHYVLLAEFDIDAGATLAYQYPYPTGTDEHRLAELMLPDGAHLRGADWTIFYLGQSPSSAIAPVLSHESVTSEDGDSKTDTQTQMTSSTVGGVEKPKAGTPGGGLLYVLNCVRCKEDKSVRRGAQVKALAIATHHPFIHIYKPLLLLGLEQYFLQPGPEVLSQIYDACNNMNLIGMPLFTKAEKILLRQNERRDIFQADFDAGRETARNLGAATYEDMMEDELYSEVASQHSNNQTQPQRLSGSSNVPSRPGSRRGVSGPIRRNSESGTATGTGTGTTSGRATPEGGSGSRNTPTNNRKQSIRDNHFFHSEVEFQRLIMPVKIPIGVFDEDVGDYSVIELIVKFKDHPPFPAPYHSYLHTNGSMTPPVILIINAILANRRVLFLGSGGAHIVSRMVLAACSLASGAGSVLRGITERAFPYANLASIDVLEEFSGYVAGVANPRFEDLFNLWDVMCNIDTGKVTVGRHAGVPRTDVTPIGSANREARGSQSSLSGSMVKVDEDVGGTTPQSKSAIVAKADNVDNVFMEEIMSAIHSHYGETHIRLRFAEWLYRFTKLAAYQEYAMTGTTKIGYPIRPFRDGILGSGAVFADDAARQKEMSANIHRIDAWRKTKSYRLFLKDWQADYASRALPFDVRHQITRLRVAKRLSNEETEAIFTTLNKIERYEEAAELLSILPGHMGGVVPLANGLFHPSKNIRFLAVELLFNLQRFEIGRQAVAAMNYYHRKAYLQLVERFSNSLKIGATPHIARWSPDDRITPDHPEGVVPAAGAVQPQLVVSQ